MSYDIYNFYCKEAQDKNKALLTDYSDFDANKKCLYNCPVHGTYECTPAFHKNNKYGCVRCSYVVRGNNISKKLRKLTISDYIDSFNSMEYMIHTYDVVFAKGCVYTLQCSKHGETQRYSHQLYKTGCLYCKSAFVEAKNERKKKEGQERNKIRLEKLKEYNVPISLDEVKLRLHNKFHDYCTYDLSNYINLKSKIKVICDKHGEYETSARQCLSNSYACRYCSKSGHSKKEYKWLKNFNITTLNYYIKIDDYRFYADGYDESTNTIYEYLGDYWHGNLSIYPEDQLNMVNKKSMKKLFEDTKNRFDILKNNGYNIVYTWESDNDYFRVYNDVLEY